MTNKVTAKVEFTALHYYTFDTLTDTLVSIIREDIKRYHSCYVTLRSVEAFYSFVAYDIETLVHIIKIFMIYHKYL